MGTLRILMCRTLAGVILLSGLTMKASPGAAQSSSLFVDTMGQVGIGTDAPQGNLHIAGAADNDLFNGIGPNLSIGPAFNFGYSGGSFLAETTAAGRATRKASERSGVQARHAPHRFSSQEGPLGQEGEPYA